MIAAIILAAGKSERMAQSKQLLDFGGAPMLATVAQKYFDAKISRVLVVVAPHADAVKNSLRDLPVEFVENYDASKGMFTSVQAGLRALDKKFDALVGLADQPSLSVETIQKISAAREKNEIVIPTRDGRGGHPVLICKKFFGEILSMSSALTLKHFVAAHPREVLRLEVADAGVVQDIDDWPSYQRELAKR
jgi:molybdenum cofactor cytidylyltransferase